MLRHTSGRDWNERLKFQIRRVRCVCIMHELQWKVGVRQQGRVSGSGRVLRAPSLQSLLRVM